MKSTATDTITEVLNAIADHKAQFAERTEAKFELSESDKDRLIALEPTDRQIALLKKFRVSDDDILSMNRFHAAEMINNKIAERQERLDQKITEKMIEGLLKWGVISEKFSRETLSQLTIGQGKRIYASLPRLAA